MAEKLKEQNAYSDGVFIQRRRASAPTTRTEVPPPAHYGGAYADDEEDDALYNQRPPSSARKYRQQPEVYTRGKQKIVVHREPPRGRRFHWMIFMGMVLFVMVLGWLLLTAVGYWWQGKQDDFKYGTPRTFQEDMFVGHRDSPDHPDHFIAVNVGGVIQVVELNPQNPQYDHVYPITTSNSSTTPVFLSFEDTRHTGRLDMLVTIGESNSYTVILLNNGTEFSK